MKKVIKLIKREKKHDQKKHEKAQKKTQSNNIKKLIIQNC